MLGWNLKGLHTINKQAFLSHNLDQISLKVQGRTKVHLSADIFVQLSWLLFASLKGKENDEGERENHCYCEGYRYFKVKTGEQVHFAILSMFGDETTLNTKIKLYKLIVNEIWSVEVEI